ncbi:mannose-1-phosphate guanylyltransferase [Pancytospora philotis]|nr:mannose-1-phosphate guanylyltransferase [Pancytospora philotis]
MERQIDKAIILVGGWGTRLRPLTYTIPKPLVPFCNRPMLKYQIEKLVAAGVRTIVLAINYYSELIISECAEYEQEFGIRIIYSKEDSPLGTAGPLALARAHLAGSSFFVLNSDICCDADLAEMRARYAASACLAMVMTHPVEDPTKYGLVKIKDALVTAFIEKPKVREEHPRPWIINAGVYIFSEAVLDLIEPRAMSLETEVFPVLAANGQLSHFLHSGYWMDIGQIKDYLEGQRIHLTQQAGAQHRGDDAAVYASPGMYPAENVVIGRNVRIGKNVSLRNCAVFDGVVIGDDSMIANSVIGWDCVIGSGCCINDAAALGQGVSIANGLSINALKINPKESLNIGNMQQYKVNA